MMSSPHAPLLTALLLAAACSGAATDLKSRPQGAKGGAPGMKAPPGEGGARPGAGGADESGGAGGQDEDRADQMSGSPASVGGATGPLPEGRSPFVHVNGFEPRFLPPAGAAVADIKRDFGAVGDGKADDTAAFKQAIESDEPRTIFIPAGTYLIKQPLRYGEAAAKKKRVLLIGEQRSQTVLRLADRAEGFGDPSQPRVFIHTRGSKQQAEQNMHMYIYHLTIEVGRGNPGAIALNFHTNNTGALKDVTVRATEPAQDPGFVGVAFDDHWFGPGNARYLEVDGFKTGVRIGSAQNHTTLEHVAIRHCELGLDNTGYGISVRNLQTFGCARAVRASGGLTVLVDSHLLGGSRGTAIDLGKSSAMLANVKTEGYDRAVGAEGREVKDGQVDLFTSSAPASIWGNAAAPLRLPVQESPELPYPTKEADFAVVGGSGDISGALQTAIDAGKKTIYVTGGRIEKTVELRNALERIMGAGVRTIDYETGTAPAFRLRDGESTAVIIELLYENYGSTSGVTVEQASKRTLVFRHGSGSYRTAPAGRGGRVFIESVVGYPFAFDGVEAWLRDINTEMGGDAKPNIVNTGGTLWVLGQKTEDYATKLATRAGGRSELLGGSYRQNWDEADGVGALVEGNPLFSIDDGSASLSYLTWPTHAGAPSFKYLVRETRGNETRNLVNEASGGEGAGNQALFVGRPPK